MMNRAQTVLKKTAFQASPEVSTFFGKLHGEEDEPQYYTGISLPNEDVADMGNPDTITVTVEPGDLLNQ